MSNAEIVIRAVVLVVGLCLLVFVVAAARCAWIDCQGRKRAERYRARQREQLELVRQDRERDAARRDRNIRQAVQFGSSNHPRHWRHESPPVVPFDDDFGGLMGAKRRDGAA